MKRWNYSKKFMTAVCLMFAGILSLCSINVLNYTNLNTTTLEEVADDALNDDSSFNENLGEEENAETSDETSEEVSQGNENETNGDDGTTPPENDTENTTNTSEEDDLDDVATATLYIDTEEELRNMSSTVNYTLTGNIRLTSTRPWIPISYSANFNGNGYTISGINVTSSSGSAGFFSTLSGSVSNVILEGKVEVSSSLYVGGVAGTLESRGSISDVWNKMNVYGGSANSVGGIVGYDNGSVSSCLNEGYIEGDTNVGGIVGATYDDNLSYCINKGTVSGDVAGGILGYTSQDLDIYQCVNLGRISGGSLAGGIVGKLGIVSLIGNQPIAGILSCVNTGSVTAETAGLFGGDVDAVLAGCYFTNKSGVACGESNNSRGDAWQRNKLAEAMREIHYYDDYITLPYTGIFGSVQMSDFVSYIEIYVAVENENGGYTEVDNNSYMYNVGFRSYDTVKISYDNDRDCYYMLASDSQQDIISSIINNSNEAYIYAGIYETLNGGENDLITDETSYSSLYNELEYDVIYVRFDLNPTEITANVYYSTSFSSNGTFPSNAYSGTAGGEATIRTESSNQTLNINPSATIETEKGDTITFTMSARSGYELVGLFMVSIDDSGRITGRTNILAGNSSNVSVDYNGSLSEITYSFENTNITSGGEMVENYHIVFARYQTYFTISESYTTDREEFVEEFGATVSKTTYVTYGYQSRSLHYEVDRRTYAGFYINDLRTDTITLSAGSSSNPFFAGNRAWYVANCGTSFYWGGEEEFSFNNISNLPNGITAYDSSNPYFEVDLWSYYYGGDMSFSFKEYSVNLDEKRGGETRIYDLYIVDGYEDIQTGEYTYGELGGTTNIRRNGRNLSKIDIYLDNGVLSDAGTNAKAFAFTNFIIDYYYEFVYDSRSPFDSHFYDENYGGDYLERAEKVSDTAISAFTEATNATISKTVNYGFNDAYGYDYRFADDHTSDSGYDLSQNSVLELIDLFSESESSVAQENIENFNIVLFSKFAINSYNLTVQLDSAYSAYSGSDSPFSVSVNGVMQTAQNDSTNKFVINNIRAYSEIEIIINDIVFFNTSGSTTYQVYTYDSISNGSTFMANQDSYHFQIIPEENGALINYRVNYNLASSFNNSYISSDIERVGNTWYIDEASDFYYLYYLNLSQGEDFSGIRLVQTENIDFGGAYIIPLGYSVTAPFSGYYDGQYYTISDFNINMGNATDVGFFGFVDGAEIKNVTLLDGTVSGNSYMGGVVGYALSSTLTRLGNYSVEVSSTGREASNNIFVYTSSNSLVALNADNVGSGAGKYDVNVDELMKDLSGNIAYTTSSQSSIYVGGFAGGASNTSFDTCFSRGEVDSDATTSAGFVGGTTSCSLSYCYTTLSTFAGSGTIGSHNHATNGKDIVDEVCSTCADRFIW